MSHIENAIAEYYSGEVMAARTVPASRITRRLQHAREAARCCGCGHDITARVEVARRGIYTFHPSCAQRWDSRRQPSGRYGSITQREQLAAQVACAKAKKV